MTTVTTKEDFDGLLQDKQAILFTYFDWSGQAHISLRVFEEWEREWRTLHPATAVSIYRLNPDCFKEAWGWLGEQVRSDEGIDGGFGSVSWLRLGKRVGFIRYTAEAGKDTLSHMTDVYFGSVVAS